MAVMNVTLTSPGASVSGDVTAAWTLPAGRRSDLAYVGVYRQNDRDASMPLSSTIPPFSYLPVAATGSPTVPYGVLPDPQGIALGQNRIVFDGSYPSTGRVPNGSYILWVLVVHQNRNSLGEVTSADYGVATTSFAVTNSVQPDPPRIPVDTGRPPPPPTLSITGGSSTTIILTPPQGLTADRVKVAVYRQSDIGGDGEPTARPVAYTDSGEPGSDTGAEWVNSAVFSINNRAVSISFQADSDTSEYDGVGVSGPIPNGDWTVRARYSSVATGRAVAYNPRTGQYQRTDSTFYASQPASQDVTITGSVDDTTTRIPAVVVSGTAPYVSWPKDRFFSNVNAALDLEWQYHNRRGVGQRSVQIRRDLAGGTNSGTRYLTVSSGNFSWGSSPDDIVIASGAISLVHGTSATLGWGGLAWGKHTFRIRPTSVGNIVGIWSNPLEVVPYRPLTISNLLVDVSGGYVRVRWSHDGASGNNKQTQFKIAVYDTDAPEDTPPAYRTTPDRDFDRWREGPARWVSGDDTTFLFRRSEPRASNPVANGTWRVAVKVLDEHNNESNTLSTSVSVSNTAPSAPSVSPRVYDLEDQVQTGTEGLIRGAYVGVAVSLGGGTVDVEEVRLDRREVERPDNLPIQDEPLKVADLPLGGATGLSRWNDFTVADRVLYQYQATAIAFTGATSSSAWTPA